MQNAQVFFVYTLYRVQALFVNAKTMEQLSNLLKDSVTLLFCKYQCQEVIASYNRIKHKIDNIGQPNKGDLKQFINSIDKKTSTMQENIDSS